MFLGFRLGATLEIYSEPSPCKTFTFALQFSNLFPYSPRLLEPWISSEPSFLDSELILYLLEVFIIIQ